MIQSSANRSLLRPRQPVVEHPPDRAPGSALRYLYGLQMFGMKAGLANIEALLSFLGNPEGHVPTVHVAGTNGKGSTSSMIAAMLTAAGYRTGLYTSPHLIRFSERIRIDGVPIPEADIGRYAELLRSEIDRRRATFFEASTALAFQYFRDRGVDIAVVETGLGGRLDATNVITPLLSVITTIGLDHTEHLGTTHARIAAEKAGIIKAGVPVLTAAVHPDALRVLRAAARAAHAPFVHALRASRLGIEEESVEGLTVRIQTARRTYNKMRLPLSGHHQSTNARLAVLAAERLASDSGFRRLTAASMRAGLERVFEFSGLRGRFELLSASPLVVADVAHNPDGIRTLSAAVRRLMVGKPTFVFGVMQDKDFGAMIDLLRPVVRAAFIVQPALERALSSSALTQEFHRRDMVAFDCGPVAQGVKRALRATRRHEAMVITGSHFVVGEALRALNGGPKT